MGWGKGNKFYPPKVSVPLYFKLYLARSLLTLFVDKGNITCSEKKHIVYSVLSILSFLLKPPAAFTQGLFSDPPPLLESRADCSVLSLWLNMAPLLLLLWLLLSSLPKPPAFTTAAASLRRCCW